jgi:AraC-type DNA-binding domain-containing proteins
MPAFIEPAKPEIPVSSAEVERAIAAFCATTGLEVCVKLLRAKLRHPTGLEEISARRALHESAFCTGVKRTLNARCKDCDLRLVPERCEVEKRQFTHVCHAGANEVIIPLFEEGTLAGVVYVGQFRTTEEQPAVLRLVSAEEQEKIEGLALLLGAYLGARLNEPRFVSESSKGYRAEAIRIFLQRNLPRNPGLAELARHLGLSTTRTAHAVREATGRSFVALRDEMRLERAEALLAGTYHKIARVAAECGFSSPQYFHRFFRRHKRMTPLAFRRRQRTPA